MKSQFKAISEAQRIDAKHFRKETISQGKDVLEIEAVLIDEKKNLYKVIKSKRIN